MPYYRRYFIPNALVFITFVTHQRTPHFASPQHLALFWDILKNVQCIHPFHLIAYVILPDHIHWIMRMPEDQPDFSVVMKSIKWNYTASYQKKFSVQPGTRIWQNRYWDHIIRDERDMERHFDYIHWNPVKHGYVQQPECWAQSSYRFWQEKGYYEPGWGGQGEPVILQGYVFE